MTSIRLLSYNIHKGFDVGNRNFVLDQIKESIRLVHADIVFLQEVQGAHDHHAEAIARWPGAPQFEFLADEIWPHFAYGKNAIYTHGHHGNAILSKFPIVSWSNSDISTNTYELRGLLHALIELPGQPYPLHCICVHLNIFQRGRRIQLERICDRILKEVPSEHPLLIAGDFNDWSALATEILFRKVQVKELFHDLHGAHARSFPSIFPLLCLDRIYYRGLTPRAAEVMRGTPWHRLSDHAALYGEVES
jgi:endonuclease/exonuclease/phosphatase family metal-dependent hydrolase